MPVCIQYHLVLVSGGHTTHFMYKVSEAVQKTQLPATSVGEEGPGCPLLLGEC